MTETAVPAGLAMETADGLPILSIPPDMKDQIAAGDAPAQYGLDSGSDQWRQENQIGCIPRLCKVKIEQDTVTSHMPTRALVLASSIRLLRMEFELGIFVHFLP